MMVQAGGSSTVPSVMPIIRQQMLNDVDRNSPTDNGSNNGYSEPLVRLAPPSTGSALSHMPSSSGGPQADIPQPSGRSSTSAGTFTLRQVADARGLNADDIAGAMSQNGVQITPDTRLTSTQQTLAAVRDAITASMPNARVGDAFAALQQPGVSQPNSAPMQGPQVAQASPQEAPAPGAADRTKLEDELRARIREGDVFNARGNRKEQIQEGSGKADLDRSKAAYQAAQAIREQLLKTNPGNVAFEENKGARVKLTESDAEAYSKDFNGILQMARGASTLGLDRIDELKSLTLQPGFYSGPLASNVKTYQQFKSIFGHDPNSAVPAEAFNKGVSDLLQDQIRTMARSGINRILLAEVRAIQAATASLDNSPAGNRAALELMRRAYVAQAAAGEIANNVDAAVGSGRVATGRYSSTLSQALQSHFEQNKLISPEEKQHPTLLAAPDAPADFMRMPLSKAREWERQVGVNPGDPIRIEVTKAGPGKYIGAL